MTDELNPQMADNWVNDQLANRARSSAIQAPKVSGDDMASAVYISKARKVPPLVVADDLPAYKEQEDLDALEAAARANPGLSMFLQKPENVALSKDDLTALRNVTKAVDPAPTGKEPLFYAPPGVGDGSFGNPIKKESWDPATYDEVYQRAPQGAWVENADGSLRKRVASTTDLLAQFPIRVSNLVGASIEAIDTFVKPTSHWLAENVGGPENVGGAKYVADALRAPAKDLNQYQSEVSVQDLKSNPLKFPQFLVRGTIQSAPDMLAAGLSWKLYALARDREIAEQRALNNNSGDATLRDQAIALPAAVIESTLEKFATSRLGVGGAGASVEARIGKETLVQGGTEFIEEGSSYLGETLGTDRGANAADFTNAGLGGLLLGGPLGTATQGTHEIYNAAINRAWAKWVDVARAVHDKNYLDNAIATAQKSKLLKRSPEKFEELLKSLVGDATLFVPVEDLQALYQSENLDPAAAVAELTGDKDAYAAAYASGGAVAIPLATYVTRLGEAHAKLGKNARLNADSVLEQRDGELKLPTKEEIQQDIENALSESRADDVRDNGPSGQVFDEVYGQLLGRTDEKSARQHASVLQSFYRNIGERMGVDAYTLYQRFKINIGSPKMPAAAKSRGIDTAIDPLIDSAISGKSFSDKDIYGGSLIPAIVALGGINPNSVGGGDLRGQDAAMRPGLLNMMGMTAERMAQTLADRGFNAFTTKDEAGRPDYRELLNLISDELGGNKVYSKIADNEQDATRIARRESFRRDAETIAGNFRKWERDNKKPITDLTPEQRREIALQSFAEPSNVSDESLDQSANPSFEFQQERSTKEASIGNPEPLYQKPGDKGNRGSITGRGGKSIVNQKPDSAGVREFNIQLLAGHDTSTFLHEIGHAFLEILGDLAADESSPAQIREDWAKTMAWLGVDDRSKIGRDQHEQFARGWEAYYREGKSPSGALRRVFAQFKTWLTAIYKSAKSLNVELSDDVRGVFDRMLASDAEIAAAQTQVYHEALLSDAVSVGMSEAQHDAYQRAVQEAKSNAEAEVAAEVLKAERRAQMAWWRDERKAVRSQVDLILRSLPVYRALRWIRNGLMPDGSPVSTPIKLEKQSLLDLYGPTFLKRLKGIYSATGGMTSDEAAALLGYANGGELVNAMVNAPPLQDVIDTDTDRIMAERHPDPMTDGSLPDRAMAAVHNEKQAEVMLLEIKALEGFTRDRNPTSSQVLTEVARRLISEKRAREVLPNLYRQAEAKSGREAFEAAAKKDWPAALAARRRQLLNLKLYAEAVRVRTEVDAIGKFLSKYTKNKTRAKLGKAGADYLEQIDGLLERFDFRKMSGPAADRRGRLLEWILSKRADGVTVDLPPKLLDEAFRKPYKDLTVDELRELRDGVKHLAHLADLKNTLLLNGERRDREAIDAEVSKSVYENSPLMPNLPGEPSKVVAWAKAAGWARATLGAATDMARRLDGYKDLGPVWSHTVGVIRDAINNRVNPALKSAQEAIAGIYRSHYSKAELRNLSKATGVDGVPGTWSKGRILSLALNWGNEGNREALLKQGTKRLKPNEIGTLLNTLDARDWAFVMDIWKQVDSYWPEIAESQRRRKGLVPEKVAPSSFAVTTSDGKSLTIPGGYYPLKYEADTTLGMREEADEFYESIRTGRFAKASTKDGHTIERTGSGGRAVQLDLDVIDGHLRNVIRDLHLGDAVNYVHQVIKGQDFSNAISATGNVEMVRGLDLWLRDVATGEMGLHSPAEKTARFIRTNFTASVLTYKFVSAALQVTGILQTSVVLGKGHTIEGVARYGRRPIAMTKYVTSVSPFMASRADQTIEAVQQLFDAKAGRLKAGHSAMIRWGYFMIGRVQQTVDVATWLGAEAKGMEQFAGDVKKARAYADDIVSRAQGSGEFMDKITLQRGSLGDNVRQSEWIRAATTLQGYMITKHNALIERTLKAKKGVDGFNAKSVWEGMKWAGDMANLLLIEAIVVAAIRGALPSADDDDDGDGITDEWLAFAGSESLGNLFGGIPGLGSMMTELRGYDSKGIVAGMWSEVANVIEQSKQGELDKALVKAGVKATGYASGIPSSQINKTIDAIQAEQDGEDVSPLDYLRGPKPSK